MVEQRRDPLHDLTSAVDATALLVDGIREEEWAWPTPCTEWAVRDVVAHLVLGHRVFASLLAGGEAPPRVLPDLAFEVAPTAYRETAAAMLEAFAAPGVLERPVTLPIGEVPGSVALMLRVVEALAHGWDIAQATGQGTAFDDAVVRSALDFTAATLPNAPTGTRFAEPQRVPDDARALDRLVALTGRATG